MPVGGLVENSTGLSAFPQVRASEGVEVRTDPSQPPKDESEETEFEDVDPDGGPEGVTGEPEGEPEGEIATPSLLISSSSSSEEWLPSLLSTLGQIGGAVIMNVGGAAFSLTCPAKLALIGGRGNWS